MMMMRNKDLEVLRKKPLKYLRDHGIVYDRMVLPKLTINEPFFAYFYSLEMLRNEMLMESMRHSIPLLNLKFSQYLTKNNMVLVQPPML